MPTQAFDLAYPIEDRVHGDMPDGNYLHTGLTKRELFAVQNNDPVPDSFVLVYIREKEKTEGGYRRTEGKYWDTLSSDEKAEVRAKWRVKSADALIKALNENQNQ